MRTRSLLLALAAAPAALAHTTFTDFFVDGVAQGDGVAIRMRKDAAVSGNPLEDLSSNDMACNVGGEAGVSRVQTVNDGATLTFEIRSWPNDISKWRLDRGHYGPCAVYLKKVTSAVDDTGVGDGWFKLWDDGYTADDKRWCTDRVIDNGGLMSVVLPEGLLGGYYLVRPEILALHNAYKGDPQFYTGCAQIFLQGNGDLIAAETVSIPGYVKTGEASVSVNIYYGDDLSEYVTPGPRVANLTSSSSRASAAQISQTEGLRPAGCICENANWCGEEVPDYSDEAGCWASDQNCWDQGQVCYDSSPPTGHAGCDIWEAKCKDIQTQCTNQNFNGPPNKGKDLTPAKVTTDIGLIMPTHSGGTNESPQSYAVQDQSSASSAPQSASAATSAQPEPYKTDEAASTIPAVTVPAYESAPAPTADPCPEGFKCVYLTQVVTDTVYSYVTVQAKKRSVHHKRHGRNF